MDTTKISFDVEHPGYGLTLTVKTDGLVRWTTSEAYSGQVEIDLSDADGYHVLVFEMAGKTSAHTTVDQQGNISRDAVIVIRNVAFDSVPVPVSNHAIYEHDFNSSAPAIQEPFFDTMGCNGRVSMSFSTPSYLWLLENM